MRRHHAWPAAALCAALLTGCGSVPVRQTFDDTRSRIAERTGSEVEWSEVSASPEEIGAEVGQLLAGELAAEDAVRVALLNNRRLQATFAELGIAAADRAAAGRLPNPVLEVVALFESGDVDLVELSLVAPLLDSLLLPLRRQLADDALEVVRLRVAAEVVDLIGETRRAFYDLQAALQILELERSVLLATEASFGMAEQLREAGNITALDLLTERDLLETTRLETAAAEMAVLDGRERLNRAMGLWGPIAATWQPAPRLADPLAGEVDEAELASLEATAVERSYGLAMARADLVATARRLGLTRITAPFPDIELGVAAERERSTELVRGDEGPRLEEGEAEWAVGPLLALPIPIFDQGQPALARARAEIRRRWDLYTAQAVEVRSAARSAVLRMRYSRQRAEYHRRVLIPLRQQLTYEAQLRYNGMFLGVFQLLDVKRREIAAGLGYIDALRDYWTARSDVEQIRLGRSRATPGMDVDALFAGMASGTEGAERGH